MENEYNYDAVLRVIAHHQNIPLSSGEVAQMVGREQNITAANIHYLAITKGYIKQEYYAHLDKIYAKNYFRPHITYYTFRLTNTGKKRLDKIGWERRD